MITYQKAWNALVFWSRAAGTVGHKKKEVANYRVWFIVVIVSY